MQLEAYKGRSLDPARPVRVYRNLNKRGVVYSIAQKGQVVAYATDIKLKDCTCFVNQKGVERVRLKKVREVHAWVEGYVTEEESPAKQKMSYNPYKHNHFYNTQDGSPVTEAPFMQFNQEGVHL
jgi:hypothetical protein